MAHLYSIYLIHDSFSRVAIRLFLATVMQCQNNMLIKCILLLVQILNMIDKGKQLLSDFFTDNWFFDFCSRKR